VSWRGAGDCPVGAPEGEFAVRAMRTFIYGG
jgi:hypothetical protein